MGERTNIVIHPGDWPRCHRCDMPVENFWAKDHGDSLEFIAECHGEQEVTVISDEIWGGVLGTDLGTIGTAFTDATGTTVERDTDTTLH